MDDDDDWGEDDVTETTIPNDSQSVTHKPAHNTFCVKSLQNSLQLNKSPVQFIGRGVSPIIQKDHQKSSSGSTLNGSNSGCYKCGEQTHLAVNCTQHNLINESPKSSRLEAPNYGNNDCSPINGSVTTQDKIKYNTRHPVEGKSARACYKCGEEDHIAKECPSMGGSDNRRGCFKCGEEGHISRDCPSGGGGDNKRACYKCGEEGHISKECPTMGGKKACFKCGDEGHLSRECPTGGGGDSKSGCFKCGEEGHFAKECTSAVQEDRNQENKPPRQLYIPPEPSEEEEILFRSIKKGINFNNYDSIKVLCTGRNQPNKGISSFMEADLDETVLANISKAGYDKPTPIQKWAISVINNKRDLMGCAQTGSGKTASFLLPIISGILKAGLESSSFMEYQTPQAVIVAPTRELAVQISGEARKFAHKTMLRVQVIYGGTSVSYQLQQLQKTTHLLVATPGRLLDFINRGKIKLSSCKYLVLDEADRMLDFGFKSEIHRLVSEFDMLGMDERQTLMFSATFPPEIQKMAQEFLNDYIFVTVGLVGSANSDISQEIIQVEQSKKRDKLMAILNETGTQRVLIFVDQKRNADFLATFLSQSELPATCMHGDRNQQEREEALRNFTSGEAPILVATSVASRGLDIPGVQHVINYDLPTEIDDYIHRIGRTGRCGNLGQATSFYDESKDSPLSRFLVSTLKNSQQTIPKFLEEAAEKCGNEGFNYNNRQNNKFGQEDQNFKSFKNSNNNDFSQTTNDCDDGWD